MNETNPGSDPIYKRLYSFAEMVADLLLSVLPASTFETLDLHSLEQVPAEYVGDDFHQRRGDAVWRLKAAGVEGGWTYVLVLLEFQSGSDSTMAMRVTEYTLMLQRELLRAKTAVVGKFPPVLPIVLYNGESQWTAARDVRDLFAPTGPALAPYQPSQRYILLDERHAEADYAGQLTSAVAKLEQSRSPMDLMRLADVLAKLIDGLEQEGLRRTFADWLRVLYRRLQSPDEPAPPPKLTLEEVRMTLEERVARWPDQWIRRGMEQGIEQGRAEGIEQGIERGKREQLRRQAEVRFGAETAERLFALLRREDNLQRIDMIAEAVVRCETSDELLRHAGQGMPNGIATNPSA